MTYCFEQNNGTNNRSKQLATCDPPLTFNSKQTTLAVNRAYVKVFTETLDKFLFNGSHMSCEDHKRCIVYAVHTFLSLIR